MKRPYKTAHYEKTPVGFAVLLDGKGARTPSANALVVPSEGLARAIADEWASQGETIRKETMPLTQVAVIAIDLVMRRKQEVVADMLAYSETDLACYRAGGNDLLQKRQGELLDPVLAWAEERFGVAFAITDGVMPVKQPHGNHAKLGELLQNYNDWKLAALAAGVKPLGSLILGLAFLEGRIGAAEAFELAHLEESFQTQAWGADEEKEARMQRLRGEIAAVERFLKALSS